MNKEPLFFIEHILKSITKIKEFTLGLSKEKFLKDELRKSAVVKEVEVIGEAVKNLPIEFTNKYHFILWSEIARMRDKLIHHYFGIDYETVWKVIKDDLPQLEKEIKEIIRKESIK